MQCANACWVSSAQVPLIRASKWEANKLSIAQTRTNQPLGNPPNGYCDDGDDDDSGGSSSSSSSSWVVGFPLAGDVKFISGTSNPFVKHCLKLRLSSSYRHSHASSLVVGSTPIREIYRFQESKQERRATIDCLLVLDKAKIPDCLDDRCIRIVHVSSMVMKKLSGLQSTESIEAIALMKIPSTFHNLDDNWQEADCHGWFPSPHRILVLDGIQDPGNVGTLLRSALAFKWGGAFLLPSCCDPFNDKALRASQGASFQLPIVSGTWTHLEALRNKFHLKILAGHPKSNEQSKQVSRLSQGLADSLTNLPLCLVLGGEGSGLSAKTRQIKSIRALIDSPTDRSMILLLRRSSSSSNRCLRQGKEVVGSVDTAAVVVVHLYGGDAGLDKGEGRVVAPLSLRQNHCPSLSQIVKP
ncbi:putative tRNA/rRNA methyltransferase slr1673 [Camellia lanceoleosa]|uniref:tRNA/rRNA methyltransferase slr1673 n=1 Tax=Camellia lanceoleosa TaxID=1840588 RepID=A0ACC0ITB4_9ERIC|nr:putative tRNA/rRNA methyltransferase slr1673 [Camellia lanceoleosa]